MEESKKESVKKEQESLKSTMKVQCKFYLNFLSLIIEEMIKSGMKVTTVGTDGQIITGIATVPADKSGCCVIF
jgi:uncharacterized membrane protein